MHQWPRNDKFAFLGVILAAIGLACGLFGQEIRQSLGLQESQTLRQSTLAGPATGSATGSHSPQGSPPASPVPVTTITVSGNGETISLQPSSIAGESRDYEVEGSASESDFLLGPKQTARVEFTGNGNTLHLSPKLAGRVTVVDNGKGNEVTH